MESLKTNLVQSPPTLEFSLLPVSSNDKRNRKNCNQCISKWIHGNQYINLLPLYQLCVLHQKAM